jgi:hypothetical protein
LPFEEGQGRVRGGEAPRFARLRANGLTQSLNPDCAALDRALEAGRIEFAQMQALQLQRLHGDYPALGKRTARLKPAQDAAGLTTAENFEIHLPPLKLASSGLKTAGNPQRRAAPGLVADADFFFWSEGECLRRIFLKRRFESMHPSGLRQIR